MNKNILLLTLSLLITAVTFGQEYILKEDFDNNNNEWPFIEQSENGQSYIRNGHLDWHNKSKKGNYQSTYFFTNEDWTKNFKITTKFKLVSGRKDNLLGLYFSSNEDRENYYRFGISDNGHWKTYARNEGKDLINSGWIKTDLIKQGDYNTLEVRKLGNHTFLSINGKVVDFHKDLKEIGKYVALTVCDSAHVLFDYIYLEQTNEEKKELKEAMAVYLAQLDQKSVVYEEKFDENSKGWNEGEEKEFYAEFKSGTYLYANKTNGFSRSAVSNASQLNWSLDFVIEAKIKRNSGTNNNLYGVFFGYENWNNYNSFGYAPTGFWKVEINNNKSKIIDTGWRKTNLLIDKEYNVLTIEKVGNQLVYFINYKPVYVGSKVIRTGSNLGFWITNGGVMRADYLKATNFYRSEKEQESRVKEITSKLEKLK